MYDFWSIDKNNWLTKKKTKLVFKEWIVNVAGKIPNDVKKYNKHVQKLILNSKPIRNSLYKDVNLFIYFFILCFVYKQIF